ncbi:hypothetical protein RO07_06345 [Pandoraea pulmonicola]|uniref:Uncharacterized protein n=1 Tax=Pandoraea pulmonicola TaxID=93221 RepID=A0ABM5RXK0_PANPU|nr:hypothetical protein RO07_06345 [Pandoraea pulmonicola]
MAEFPNDRQKLTAQTGTIQGSPVARTWLQTIVVTPPGEPLISYKQILYGATRLDLFDVRDHLPPKAQIKRRTSIVFSCMLDPQFDLGVPPTDAAH